MANFVQAHRWLVYDNSAPLLATYIQAGCNHSEVKQPESNEQLKSINGTTVLLIQANQDAYQKFSVFSTQADSHSAMIINNISSSKKNKRVWQCITQDHRSGVTFDLYYCGIVFFDHTLHKQNYIINF
ncbi:MAG TPA: hypothetical protein VIQ97_01900 [Prevotella sp.]